MRMNIYPQELMMEVTPVSKKDGKGIMRHGIRLTLDSPESLRHSAADDDRSAITFWCPPDWKTAANTPVMTREDMAFMFEQMATLARSLPAE